MCCLFICLFIYLFVCLFGVQTMHKCTCRFFSLSFPSSSSILLHFLHLHRLLHLFHFDLHNLLRVLRLQRVQRRHALVQIHRMDDFRKQRRDIQPLELGILLRLTAASRVPTFSASHAGTVFVEIIRSIGALSSCSTAFSSNSPCDSTTLIFRAPCSFSTFATRHSVSPVRL